jgi:V/A-type H+-transporting ATPase subunit B
MTHPIPDLTGYITEGQIVLNRDLHRRTIFPPIDILPSLSRLMGSGIGEGHTHADHREISNRIYGLYARGREALTMATVVGTAGLTEADQRAVDFASRFEQQFLAQLARRTIAETLDIGRSLIEGMP